MITIVVGNVGAIGQSSLKRMLAYSSVAQAGYMLAGVVVTTRLGISATVFYLAIYVVMNLAAFAVITARERETGLGDDISSLYGLGADRPWLAWPMTIAMLALAGFPATAGFFGKLYLINAAVDNGYAWLGIVIVLGSGVSLAYYLRVVAAVWMRSPSEAPAPLVRAARSPGDRRRVRGGRRGGPRRRPRARRERRRSSSPTSTPPSRCRRTLRQPEVIFVAVACALVTIVLRHLPRAAVQRRQGRRRRDSVAALAASGGEFSRAPPMRGVRSHPTAGQATLEYIAAVALLAALLVVAAPAVGAPDIARAVADAFQHGLCVVGGDVCIHRRRPPRRAPAVSAAVRPDRRRGLRDGVQRRARRQVDADGHAALGRHRGGDARRRGGSAGVAGAGARGDVGPVRFEVGGGRRDPRARCRRARGWVFRDAATAKRFLEHATRHSFDDDRWPPTWQSAEVRRRGLGLARSRARVTRVATAARSAARSLGAGTAIGWRWFNDGSTTRYARFNVDGAEVNRRFAAVPVGGGEG